MTQANVLDMFNAIVVQKDQILSTPDTSMISIGVVLDFKPNSEARRVLQEKFQPLPIKTLFGRDERLNGNVMGLITKQLLHYIEVYGLGVPGLFDLEVTDGVLVKTSYVKGITQAELTEKVQALLYANAPIAKLAPLVEIIKEFKVSYDFDKILNNEARIQLYDPQHHKFATGDDAVRYLVFKATDNTLVIKNKRVQDAIKVMTIDPKFFTQNEDVLAQVFNRFKTLILAAKHPVGNNGGAFAKLSKLKMASGNPVNTAINRIARKSKTLHKPVYEGLNKRFLSEAVKSIAKGTFQTFSRNVSKLSVRDKFKLLNLIEYKAMGYSVDAFMIRNGTVHIEQGRDIMDPVDLDFVRALLVDSLALDYEDLKGKRILLDPNVDYGLPISRKQALGNLPFGTTITIADGNISTGVYWRNDWGARDLDLSTVDLSGKRVGWGGLAGYNSKKIIFSGDVTSAHDGAMEFMTSKDMTYGLFVNIFAGEQNCDFELVVGNTTDKRWMDNVVVREKSKLMGRGSCIGFVQDDKFKVFQGKLNDRIANFGEGSPVINRSTCEMWTVRRLLDAINVPYTNTATAGVEYDIDLSYAGFSLDKLEKLLYI